MTKDDLPYVDEHAITIDAPRDVVWTALQRHVTTSLRLVERGLLVRILRTEPRAGFEVAESVPGERLSLVGRHRFSRYRLDFELADADGATRLNALTYAVFPGVRGRIYRTLVIGTRGHVLATNHVLRSIRQRSTETARQ
jgi:hypothetical protein